MNKRVPTAAVVFALMLGGAYVSYAVSQATSPPSWATPPISGAVDLSVTQDNIGSTICARGWSTAHRPPSKWTNRVKRQLLRQYIAVGRLPPTTQMRDVELDALVPIEVGGDHWAMSNLWLQPWQGPYGAHVKDRNAENVAHRMVCDGALTLHDAQAGFMQPAGEATPHWATFMESLPQK